jgi:hypothetical protein
MVQVSIAMGWRPASMKRRPAKQPLVAGVFDIVRNVGLALPDVEATTRYDGSPVLKVDGMFMAGLATHPSAEPDTLVVRTKVKAFTRNLPSCMPSTELTSSRPWEMDRQSIRILTSSASSRLIFSA